MSTTALYKALLEANVSEKTAERAVEGLAFADNIATTTDLAGLKTVITRLEAELKAALKEKATKADIAELKAALKEKATKADLARLEADLAGLKTVVARLETELKEKATKADLARLEAIVARLEAELKAELQEKATKADLANLESKMLRWGHWHRRRYDRGYRGLRRADGESVGRALSSTLTPGPSPKGRGGLD